MAKQEYRRLHNEEDGEETLSSDTSHWRYAFVVKHAIINVIILLFGIIIGIFMPKKTLSNVSDPLLQYSMVPCKSTRVS